MKAQPTVRGNNTHKVKRPFGDPVEALKPNQRFVPVPDKFKKPVDFVLNLDMVLSKPVMNGIINAKQLVFHMDK